MKEKVYFPGFNGLRFIAAVSVVIYHFEAFKIFYDINNWTIRWSPDGEIAVTLFFVLSGFLITYLLLTEKQSTENVSIKKFYVRRILRIWPLYYLIVITGLICLKFNLFYTPNSLAEINNHFFDKSLLFIFFMPNVASVSFGNILALINHSWSIGVEEQFYLLWPVFIKYLKKSVSFFIAIFGVLIIYYSLKVFFLTHSLSPLFYNLYKFLYLTRIQCMAIGAIGAYIIFFKNNFIIKIITNGFFQIVLYAFMFYFYIVQPDLKVFNYLTHEIHAILFCLIIMTLNFNRIALKVLENRALNFLGKISYGIYMFHPIILIFEYNFIKHYVDTSQINIWGNIFLHILTITLTIATASASYYFYENKFLKLKYNFSKILSGDLAK